MNEQPTPPNEAGQQPSRSPLTRDLAERVGERVKSIVEAAERTAAGIIEDAEAQAQKYLAESRAHADRAAAQRAQEMSALTDHLIDRTEAVKRQSNELLQVLDETKRRLDEAHGSADERAHAGAVAASPRAEPQPGPAPVQSGAADQPVAAARPASADPGLFQHLKAVEAQPRKEGQENRPSDGARLLTTQMAVAGSSRAEIERRLQSEFGIRDTGPMLDAILGEEE
jgi:cell division septum initiation protein DivIVA